jgi:hypothetical protein
MPRIGSIICWEYKEYTGKPNEERSYLGVVEDVIGSDVIKISKMSVHNATSNKFSCEVITNENNNWGMDKLKYKFKGFIHTLPQTAFYPNIVVDKDGCLSISCNSTTGESCSSMLFGLKDIKHFNRMKIVYDLKITPPKDGESKIIDENNHTDSVVTRLDRLDDHCNFYLHMSQQVVSCTPEDALINEKWPSTYFPEIQTETDVLSGKYTKMNMGRPFPDGAVLLSSYSKSDLTKRSKFVSSDSAYVFTDMSKTISLSRCAYDGNYITAFGGDTKIKKLNRELPTYVGVTVKSSAVEFDGIRYETEVTVRIKKIILYG